MKKMLCCFLLLLASQSVAKDLGRVGSTFPIVEEDALLWITQKRLPELQANGSIARLEKQLQTKAQKQIQRPEGTILPKTKKFKQRLLDLTVTADRDFKDAEGRIVVRKGTLANPLDILPPSRKQMVFVNGDDRAQMDWAKQAWAKNPMETRIVLIAGAIERLTEEYDLRLYFDQQGALVERFQIQHVPAVVKRFGNKLLIEEVVI